MPIYTCTFAAGTLTSESKTALAGEIATVHSAVNHVPRAYVNVDFVELPTGDVFAGGEPGKPLTITGLVRRGHPQEDATRLALELASAATRVSGVDKRHVTVILQDVPAASWVEDGRPMPEPGQEGEWLKQAED